MVNLFILIFLWSLLAFGYMMHIQNKRQEERDEQFKAVIDSIDEKYKGVSNGN